MTETDLKLFPNAQKRRPANGRTRSGGGDAPAGSGASEDLGKPLGPGPRGAPPRPPHPQHRPDPDEGSVFRTLRDAFHHCKAVNGDEEDPTAVQLPPAERLHVFMMQCPSPPAPFKRRDMWAGPWTTPFGTVPPPCTDVPPRQSRFFLCTTYHDLWSRVEGMRQAKEPLHFYEVIPEGKPCYLYLDCEYEYLCKLCGPVAAGQRRCACTLWPRPTLIIPTLVRCLNRVLQGGQFVDLDVPEMVAEHVLELLSEYPHKFSAHYLVRFPIAACFANNAHLGRFIDYLIEQMAVWAAEDPDVLDAFFLRPLTEASPLAKPVCIIDQAVYTRNRMMRCFLSTKMGKNSPLLVSKRCRYPYQSEQDVFFASLICNVDEVGVLPDGVGPEVQNTDIVLFKFGTDADRHTPRPCTGGGLDPAKRGPVMYGPSPFPELDEYFHQLVRLPCGRGRVRSWVAYRRHVNGTALTEEGESNGQGTSQWGSKVEQAPGEGEKEEEGDNEEAECPHCAITHIVYNVVDNRFCLNVGREHRSNAIYFVINVRDGVYHQKCYDSTDCPNFRSAAFPLPRDAVPVCRNPASQASLSSASSHSLATPPASATAEYLTVARTSLLGSPSTSLLRSTADRKPPPPPGGA
eukprot:EG_transcript_6492